MSLIPRKRIPQEIIDNIVDQLWEDPKDIKSCFQTARTFVHRCRRHIFHSVTLSHWNCQLTYQKHYDRAVALEQMPQVHRFIKELYLHEEKPSEIHSVHLKVTAEKDSTSFWRILSLLKQVRGLRLHGSMHAHLTFSPILDHRDLYDRFPSVTRLYIDYPLSLYDEDKVSTFLKPFIQQLSVIEVVDTEGDGWYPQTDSSFIFGEPSGHMVLNCCIPEAIRAIACSLKDSKPVPYYQTLSFVEMMCSSTPGFLEMVPLLRLIGPSLEEFSMDLEIYIDLGTLVKTSHSVLSVFTECTKLRKLEMSWGPPPEDSISDTLKREFGDIEVWSFMTQMLTYLKDSKTLEDISLFVPDFYIEPDVASCCIFDTIDSILSGLPALRNVEIATVFSNGDEDQERMACEYYHLLPCLTAREDIEIEIKREYMRGGY